MMARQNMYVSFFNGSAPTFPWSEVKVLKDDSSVLSRVLGARFLRAAALFYPQAPGSLGATKCRQEHVNTAVQVSWSAGRLN